MKRVTEEIDLVVFRFPEIVNDVAELFIKDKYKQLLKTESDLLFHRKKTYELELKVSLLKDELKSLNGICTIKYKEEEIDTPKIEQCNMAIINPSDARHTNH